MDDDAFIDAFRRAAIHPRDFDHRAHIRMAFLHLRDMSSSKALAQVRSGLQRFLAAAKEAGHDLPVGYHETVTRFWLHMVRDAMRSDPDAAAGDSTNFCDAHPHLMRRQLLLDYYSRERVMTSEAHERFVDPDLKPLPGSG